jgi:two-component system, sensor histidine kinase and response regulator
MKHFLILMATKSYTSNQTLILLFLFSLLFGLTLLLNRRLKLQAREQKARNEEFLRELAEQRLYQEELQRAKETAENSNQAKNEYLSKISQEIRNPMNGIIGMTELAMATQLTQDQKNYLQTVQNSANSLLAMVNEILDFSKIETGTMELESIKFNLRESLADALKDLTFTAEANGLAMQCRIEDEVPETLVGDPGRVRQIVVNLLKNAIKFTEEGEIGVHIGPTLQQDDTILLHFTVSDTGVGIPSEKQDGIFEAHSAKESSQESLPGAGLRLPITAQLLRLMGGDIQVQSPTRDLAGGPGGPGTTFLFTLPFRVPLKAEGEAQEVLTLKGISVLIVDDCPRDRQELEHMVSLWEMKPVLVKNAVEAMMAMEAARNAQTPFDLAILDANLPEIDGFTLAQEIKQSEYFRNTRTILLTSAAMRGDGQKCRELRISAYLPKPIDQSDLLHAIMVVMGTNSSEALVTRHSLKENRKSLQILLAEDNKINQKFTTRLLEKWGHQVILARTGKEVAAALKKQPFDLVLMDIMIPQLDGMEATRTIRDLETGSGRTTLVVAMATAVSAEDQEKFRKAGMNGFLSKPIRIDELYTVTHTVNSEPPQAGFRRAYGLN